MLTSNLSEKNLAGPQKRSDVKGQQCYCHWGSFQVRLASFISSTIFGSLNVDEISCAAVEVSKSKLNMLRKWKYWYQAYSTMSSRAPKVHARCQKGEPCCHGATSSYNSHFVEVFPALYYNLSIWNDCYRYICSMTSSTLTASALSGMITGERWTILKALCEILWQNIHCKDF